MACSEHHHYADENIVFVKLKDLIELFDFAIPDDLLDTYPQTSNFEVRYTIQGGERMPGVVFSVSPNHHHPSRTRLRDYLELGNVSDKCLLGFTKADYDKLFLVRATTK